jgi:hypothetical protein
MNLKTLINKKGSYLTEAAIALPVFIIAVIVMNSVILMYACIEDCSFIAASELRRGAAEAVMAAVAPFEVKAPYEIKIVYSDCRYLEIMKEIHPEIFEDDRTVVMRGDNLLKTWSQYLIYEKEMVNYK